MENKAYQTVSVYEYLGLLENSSERIKKLRENAQKFLNSKDKDKVNAQILETLLD